MNCFHSFSGLFLHKQNKKWQFIVIDLTFTVSSRSQGNKELFRFMINVGWDEIFLYKEKVAPPQSHTFL